MRIIDKNHDFYDYLQDPTDNSIVFDRRNSFLLEKSYICEKIGYLSLPHYCINDKYRHILLQCGGTFWLFLLDITEYRYATYKGHENTKFAANYEMIFIGTWKNYDVPNRLFYLRILGDSFSHIRYDRKTETYSFIKEKINIDSISRQIIETKYRSEGKDLSTFKVTKSTKNGTEEKVYTIPLLRASGMADLINPIDIFCAIEEYFSREKTAAERTEPLGATNDDKIIMHGFDTKTSFRGKNK